MKFAWKIGIIDRLPMTTTMHSGGFMWNYKSFILYSRYLIPYYMDVFEHSRDVTYSIPIISVIR